MAGVSVPSRSQVKKAGSTIRKCLRGELTDPDQFAHCTEVMEAWRRAHYQPLVTANNGLRSMARTVGVSAEVTQRLKRRQTILDKLKREPTLDLSRMQDIGGCRAVVETIGELRRLESRIKHNRTPIGYSDYISEPRQSGYRAVHVVVEYQDRAIEIQLRTRWMHAWALAAEYYSAALGTNLKQDGTHPIQLFLATAAEIITLQAEDQPVPESLQELHTARRIEAMPYLPRGQAT